MKLQEANEKHKSQIQCQLEQQQRYFHNAPTINVSEQKLVTNACRLVSYQSQCTLPTFCQYLQKAMYQPPFTAYGQICTSPQSLMDGS